MPKSRPRSKHRPNSRPDRSPGRPSTIPCSGPACNAVCARRRVRRTRSWATKTTVLRGRIQLMHMVARGELPFTRDVQRHLDRCLACQGCESACPHGVEYGRLIHAFRQGISTTPDGKLPTDNRFHRRMVRGVLANADRARHRLGRGRWTRRIGLDRLLLGTGLWRLLPRRAGRLLTLLPRPSRSAPRLPLILPPLGRRRACVALFTGCLADALFRQIHWATARVLQRNGCEVFVLRSQVCCGAFHLHCGDLAEAENLAAQNAALFNANHVDAIITNTGGCGAVLKACATGGSETPDGERRKFAAKVRDITEFLDVLGILPPPGEILRHGDLPRGVWSRARPGDPRAAPELAAENPWTEPGGVAGSRSVLRCGGYVQLHRAGPGGSSVPPQAGPYPGYGGGQWSRRATSPACCTSPARRGSNGGP